MAEAKKKKAPKPKDIFEKKLINLLRDILIELNFICDDIKRNKGE